MGKPKSLTEQAMRHRREAYVERICKDPPIFAELWEREAEKLLTLPNPPNVGPGGEVVREQQDGLGYKRANIRDTLAQGASTIAEEASIHRADLLMQSNFDCLAMGIDAAESINAANSIEKMLAHQMAATHDMAMHFANRALDFDPMRDPEKVTSCRCANAAARLMSVFNEAALTLQRLRTGGTQTMTVQHVNVQSGAQAVIGNVRSKGNRGRRGGQNSAE